MENVFESDSTIRAKSFLFDDFSVTRDNKTGFDNIKARRKEEDYVVYTEYTSEEHLTALYDCVAEQAIVIFKVTENRAAFLSYIPGVSILTKTLSYYNSKERFHTSSVTESEIFLMSLQMELYENSKTKKPIPKTLIDFLYNFLVTINSDQTAEIKGMQTTTN